MRMVVLAWTLALTPIVCVACDVAGPETIPKDPGTVVAHLTDQAGTAMKDVWVYVHDIPNSVGSTFSVGVPTNATGTARFDAIPAGERRVDVQAPPGYTAPPAISVTVVKGKSVNVAVVLTRD